MTPSHAFADKIGCALAGTGEASSQTLAAVLSQAVGPAMVFGNSHRMRSFDAALLNGVAAHGLDFDDCDMEMDGHPYVPIVPALLVLGDLLNSCRAEICLAQIFNRTHADCGWYLTVMFGAIGAAIACRRHC